MKTILKKIAAFITAAATILCGTTLTAYAEKNKAFTVESIIETLKDSDNWNDDHNYVVDDPKVDTTPMPSKFDLRDVDGKCYVPEVRDQTPFGTCWSFGATAAAEISAAYEYDADFNTMTEEEKTDFDFSEHHTAWFAYEPVHEDDPVYSSQAGEGLHLIYSSDYLSEEEKAAERFNNGGMCFFTLPLYAQGVGPAPEYYVPYSGRNNNHNAYLELADYDENGDMIENSKNIILNNVNMPYDKYLEYVEKAKKVAKNIKEDFDGAGKYYYTSYELSENDDWTVDYLDKYIAWQLDNASILPNPTGVVLEGEYNYNPQATDAIKRELLAGRGVAVGFCADVSMPGQIDEEGGYMSFLTKDGKVTTNKKDADIWAHYTYDKEYDPADPESVNKAVDANHCVCIVGYDDDFPKEYFNDPNGTIGGNGAWIVRNSWGSADNSVNSSKYYWGNGGSGYFYISYYDQSFDEINTFDFRTAADEDDDNSDGIFNHMYDFLPNSLEEVVFEDNDVYMANVFEEEGDSLLTDIGLNTVTPNSTVRFEVYLMNEGSKTPTDGEKVLTAEKTFDYGGFHCIKLDKGIVIPDGQKYSIVASIKREDGINTVTVSRGENEKKVNEELDDYREQYIKENGTDLGFDPREYSNYYCKAVINKGESYIGAQRKNVVEWADWKDVTDKVKKEWDDNYDFDNLSIRAYVRGNVLTVKNDIVDPKAAYEAGDVLEGTITIKNDITSDSVSAIENIGIKHSLDCLDEEDAFIECLMPGEVKTINYCYTVTEEDVKSGSIVSTVNITVNGEPYGFVKELDKSSFSVTTQESEKPPVPEIIKGDVNGDVTVNVRDAAHIAKMLSQGKDKDLPESADFNGDGKINVRDAAAIARFLSLGMK